MMKCVDRCSFMKKEKESSTWFCSLYNKNLIDKNDYIIACPECEEKEIESLKDCVGNLNKIKNIINRM